MQPAAGGSPITPNRSNDGTNQRLLRTPNSTSPLNRRHLRRRILRRRRHHPLEQPFNSATNPLRSLPKPLPLRRQRNTNHHPPSTFLQPQPPFPPSHIHHHPIRPHLRRRYPTGHKLNKLRFQHLEIQHRSLNRILRQIS
ncbi:hypothetical protein R3W88_022187 [Solanum pinnatisectum]|uniref:Uncharacterized protein n=1 Tax=Solanum pinnatisectum TaxID=50273 RepID=A0AAV9LXB5_9SOLN|nr:hypothetical protein R3W88_022187 [Solanum pinnatisectum]